MRLPQLIFTLLAIFTTIHAFAIPSLDDFSRTSQDLFKRKGGGGGGGKGGSSGSSSSGSSSSGSSGSSSSSGSSGSSSSGGRSGSSGTSGSTSSSSSGRGTSAQPSYSGGRYAGGATSGYKAGGVTPSRLSPGPLLFAGAALTVFPAVWLYGAYAYSYPAPWHYYNRTASTNETHPVTCLCGAYDQCGCDNSTTDQAYIDDVANNNSIARLADVNGTQTLVINGSLPNDTSTTTSAAAPAFGGKTVAELSGWWIVVAGVTYTMWFM